MPDPETPPPPPQQPQGPWWLKPFYLLFSMNADQQRGAVALLCLFGGGWLIYYLVTESRQAENERTALTIRAFESEGEKGRQAIADVGKLTVASHQRLAVELGKLELRLADMNRVQQQLEQRVSELGSIIMELRKKLPPNEINLAPMPKLHDAIPLTGPVIG